MLVPYRHLWDLESFFDDEFPEIWRMPNKMLSDTSFKSPKADVYEEGDNVVVEAELPGFNSKDIDVEVKNDMVKIEAKTEKKEEEKKKGYYRKEISQGYCKRVIPLPVNVQEDKSEASYEKGVLKIIIPKTTPKAKEEKKVKVEVKEK